MKKYTSVLFALALLTIAQSSLFAATADQAIGKSVSFSVTNDGTSPFTYQWNKNGTAIVGATSATFTIAAVAATDAGSYTVRVTNKAGNVLSDTGTFTVTVNPTTATVSISTP